MSCIESTYIRMHVYQSTKCTKVNKKLGKKHVIHENLLKKEKNLSFSQAKDFWSTLLPLINIKLCHGFKGSDN